MRLASEHLFACNISSPFHSNRRVRMFPVHSSPLVAGLGCLPLHFLKTPAGLFFQTGHVPQGQEGLASMWELLFPIPIPSPTSDPQPQWGTILGKGNFWNAFLSVLHVFRVLLQRRFFFETGKIFSDVVRSETCLAALFLLPIPKARRL